MTLAELAIVLSIIASGLFAGLMLTLVIVLQRMWRQMSPHDYIASMQRFLPAAKGHPVITAMTLVPILAPPLASFGFVRAGGWGLGVVSIVGALLMLGVLIVTLRLNFPIYDAVMAWEPNTEPDNWQAIRARFYALNGIRLGLSLALTVCLLLVLALD